MEATNRQLILSINISYAQEKPVHVSLVRLRIPWASRRPTGQANEHLSGDK